MHTGLAPRGARREDEVVAGNAIDGYDTWRIAPKWHIAGKLNVDLVLAWELRGAARVDNGGCLSPDRRSDSSARTHCARWRIVGATDVTETSTVQYDDRAGRCWDREIIQ